MKKEVAVISLLLILALSRLRGSTTNSGVLPIDYSKPKGIRNNNPANIRISTANDWRGKVPLESNNDGEFEQFYEMVMGARAGLKLLSNYLNRGINTISKIIYKWAPPEDNNDTEGYINYVSDNSGINRNKILSYNELPIIFRYMIDQEVGINASRQYVSNNLINQAFNLV